MAKLISSGLGAILVLCGLGGLFAAGRPHGTAGHTAAPHAAPHPVPGRATGRLVPARATGRLELGRSARGRPIAAIELGDPNARRKVLVVGCIHGNETAGIAVTRRLARGRPPARVDLWLVEDLNPDGVAVGTRQNGHGVDLNRNFPWHWRPLGPRGTQQYAGAQALSEPESRIAHALIVRIRPTITIWFHQPLAVVDESGGSPAIERQFARLAGLPLRRLPRYPGSAAGWQDARFPTTSAFVVELPGGRPAAGAVARYARAVTGVAAARGSERRTRPGARPG